MSENILKFLEAAVVEAEKNMTLIQRRKYHPHVDIIRQTSTRPRTGESNMSKWTPDTDVERDNEGNAIWLEGIAAALRMGRGIHWGERSAAPEPEVILGVGDGSGNLFVRGSWEAIERVQALISENERLRREGRCAFVPAWSDRCRRDAVVGVFCEHHSGKVCSAKGCEKPANHECGWCGTLVCGRYLCPDHPECPRHR